MSYQDELEDKIDELRRIIGRKNDAIEKLQEDLSKSDNKLSSAEYKIREELAPRIKREERAYDSMVTSPSWGMSEEDKACLHYCEIGECGSECPEFGHISECTDELTNEELLEEYIVNDAIEEVLYERGLWFKKLTIDWKINTKSIKLSKKSRMSMFKDSLYRMKG